MRLGTMYTYCTQNDKEVEAGTAEASAFCDNDAKWRVLNGKKAPHPRKNRKYQKFQWSDDKIGDENRFNEDFAEEE